MLVDLINLRAGPSTSMIQRPVWEKAGLSLVARERRANRNNSFQGV